MRSSCATSAYDDCRANDGHSASAAAAHAPSAGAIDFDGPTGLLRRRANRARSVAPDAAAAMTDAGAPRTRRPASDAPTICGVSRGDEVARRAARQQALHLLVLERRKLEPANFGERRHQRDRERALRHAERARELGERRRERRPVAVLRRRRIERRAPRRDRRSRAAECRRRTAPVGEIATPGADALLRSGRRAGGSPYADSQRRRWCPLRARDRGELRRRRLRSDARRDHQLDLVGRRRRSRAERVLKRCSEPPRRRRRRRCARERRR